MSLLLDMHEARKARLVRMGVVTPPKVKAQPVEPIALHKPDYKAEVAVVAPVMPPTVETRRGVFGYAGTYDPSWRSILKAVCIKHGIAPSDVLSRRRAPVVQACREEAMLEIYRRTRMSTTQIGRCFDRHYSTVIAALDKAEAAA